MAFYGETGAGKSTLIECLRLFFKERNKRDQQE
ncbi:AAA family ATPase [Helicobacter pylori]